VLWKTIEEDYKKNYITKFILFFLKIKYMSQSFVDQVTLDYLLNKDMFNKHIKTQKAKSINKEDRKFYKKRIYNLFKELLITKEEPEDLLPDVKYAYDNFINSCINYFKTIDNNDLNQEEYKGLDETPDIINISELKDNNLQTEEDANKLLMRSIKITTQPLDNFVKRKTTKVEEKLILPKQKEIILNGPELKIKGINKKKNITNKYDETLNTKKEIQEESNNK
jgi:uncharacterized UPF0160 family protein